MMRAMPRARTSLLFAAVLAACAGVSPRPEDIAAADQPVRQLTTDEQAERTRLEQQARRAEIERRDGDAERLARSAIAIDARSARAHAVLGLVLQRRADARVPSDLALTNQADGETLLAMRLAPADPIVGLLRGTFLARSGHVSAAAAAGEACLRNGAPGASAESDELLAATAEWCYELGEEKRAVSWLRPLAERRPEDAATQFRLGNSLLRVADNESESKYAVEAAHAFERCAELTPGDGDARFAIAAAWVRAAELAETDKAPDAAERARCLEQAAAACTEAAGRFPRAAEPCFRAGVVAERRGDAAAARAAYAEALQRDAEHLATLLDFAALLAASDADADHTQAKELWRRALDVDRRSGALRAGERTRIERLLAR
jgi:tetratricopeptide (TPR) repeat protein